MSFTAKILLWSLVLIFIFISLTMYFFQGMRYLVTASDQIVNRDFEVVSNSKQLMETTLLFVENWRKYEILEEEKYYQASLEHLEALDTLLQKMPAELDIAKTEQALDASKVEIEALSSKYAFLLDEKKMSQWIEDITQVRNEYLQKANREMQEMYRRGTQLQHFGLLGLGLVTFLAFAGSLTIAYFMNRSLRELRRGISRYTRHEDFLPVKVVSHGELGQLAKAFNKMGARLKREEEMRSEFISMLSHEIRTPLTSIRESVSLVREGVVEKTSPEHCRFLEIAQKETLRLSELFQRLMQAASLGSRDLNLNPVDVHARKLFEETVGRLQSVAKRADINLLLANDQAIIFADLEHVQQVLLNLLGNAAKASPSGSTVTVGLDIQNGNKMAQIYVQDQGPGIPDQEKELIFERYYRAKDTRGITDGAGLGLYISRHIVRAHGGELWVEDALPQGSIFRFTLPLGGEGGTERLSD